MAAPAEFIEFMTLPVRQAMAAVRWLEGRVENRPKAGETRPAKAALSDADCVSQEILLVALREHWPDVVIDAEEDTPQARTFAGNRCPYTVVVDPIDGTLRYLEGDGLYAILVGLEHAGRVEASLVALPQLDLLFRAVRGGGAQLSRDGGAFESLRVDDVAGADRVLVSYGLPDAVEGTLRAKGLQPSLGAGGAIGVSPLLAETAGGLRLQPGGLSRRTWVGLLPTFESGGVAEALDGPLPECHESGVRGLRVARSQSGLERLRDVAL